MFKAKFTFKALLIASAVVLFFKIIYIVFHNDFRIVEDFIIAENIVKYHSYTQFVTQGPTAYKLPVYPLFLSFFLLIFGNSGLLAISVFQAFLNFFSPLLIFKTLELFGREKVGFFAGVSFILSPSYFVYPTIMEATNLFVPLVILWFYLYFMVWFSRISKFYQFLFFGILSGILFLTQVVILPLALIMLTALLIYKKASIKNMSVVILTFVLVYSPWVVRNYIVFDEIILSKTPAWQNVYVGFTENCQLLDDLKLISTDRDNYLYAMSHNVNELEMDKIYRDEIGKVTQWQPHYFIKKAAGNFISLWYVPPRYFYDNSISVLIGRKLYVVILDLLTILSLVLLCRKHTLLFWFSILFFGNFTMPYLIGHAANTRFKLDFEWYQLVLAAYFLIELLAKKKRICKRCV